MALAGTKCENKINNDLKNSGLVSDPWKIPHLEW